MVAPAIRSALRWAAHAKPAEHLVAALEHLPSAPGLLRVLTYHRVDELSARPELAPQPLSATPALFRQQMELLTQKYRVLSLAEVLDCHYHRRSLPERSVMITFDDAYLDFFEHAFPILQELALPATMFVATAFPDDPTRRYWWDKLYQAIHCAPAGTRLSRIDQTVPMEREQREQLYRHVCQFVSRLPWHDAEAWIDETCQHLKCPSSDPAVMTWDQLRAVADTSLVTLAPHTRTHPLLHRVSVERAREEVLGSVADLEREIGPTPRVLAYPGGGYSEAVVEMLREEGFHLALTTERGINAFQASDPLKLRRINVGYRCPIALWRGQLIGGTRRAMSAFA